MARAPRTKKHKKEKLRFSSTLDLEDIPTVRTYGVWEVAVKRAASAACSNPRAAMYWISQAFDSSYPADALKDFGKFERLDVLIAVNLSAKVTRIRDAVTAAPVTMQLVNELARAELIAQNQGCYRAAK